AVRRPREGRAAVGAAKQPLANGADIHARSGHGGLLRVRQGNLTYLMRAMAAAASCNVARSWSAWIDTRSRAVPGGTVGGRMARMSKPAPCRLSAAATATASAPRTTEPM